MDVTTSTRIVTALCVALLSGAALGGEGETAKPEQQGCAFRGRTYAVGERWTTGPPDMCAKYLCEDDDQIAALTCPLFIPAPGCRVSPGDEAAVYPGCCPLRKCHHAAEDANKEDANKAPAKAPAGSRNYARISLGRSAATTTTTTTATPATATMATTVVATEAATEVVTEAGTTVVVTEATASDLAAVTATMAPSA